MKRIGLDPQLMQFGLWSDPLQPFSQGSLWQKNPRAAGCNLLFSSNNLSVVYIRKSILIITSCLSRTNASVKQECCGSKHTKAVDNAVLTLVKKLCYLGNVLPWEGMLAEHKPGSPGEMNVVCLE